MRCPIVSLGDWLVLEVRLPEFLTRIVGQFRTGGRYFWPVYYILVVALVLATSQRFRPRAARILILTAVILQLADTHFLRQGAMAAAAHGHPQELKREEWRPLLAAHRFLVQYPSFQCGGWAGQWPDNNSNMELLLMAAQMDMPSNSAYLSRLNRNCEKEMAEGQNFEIADGGLYIFARRFPIHKFAKMPSFAAWCREFRYGIACSRHWDAIAKTEPVTSFRPVSQDWIPQYSRATKLKFSAGGNGLAFLGGGWSIPEPWGIWSLGGQSEIALRLSSKTNAPVRMSVSAVAFVHAARPSTSIEVFANGRQVATWAYVGGEGTKRYSLEIPESLIPETGVLRLTFLFEQVQSPKQAVFRRSKGISLGLIDLTVSE